METGVCTEANNGQTFNSLRLYNEAKACLGQSMVPPGYDPELGCAISVNEVHSRCFGFQIGGGASTNALQQVLVSSQYFKEVTFPLPGDILVSATGTSSISHTPIPNGHVGIVGFYGILSNNSNTSLWDEHFTMDSWKQRYVIQGGYKMRYFRRQ